MTPKINPNRNGMESIRYVKQEPSSAKRFLEGLGSNVNNWFRTQENDTEASNIAHNLADMEVDFKGHDGMVKRKAISADVFNNYVREHYPDIEFNPVSNYIFLEDAVGSLTEYHVKQQAAEQSKQLATMQEQSGQDSPPEFGI